MPARKDDLRDRLSRYREINLTVTGRKSGRSITNSVWFVMEGEKLYLLPVSGSDTQWYKNVLENQSVRIDAGGAESKFAVVPITTAKQVSSAIEKFRKKYGAGDEKKYYSKFNVAVVVQMK